MDRNPHWKEMLPMDDYIVSVEGPWNLGDLKVLTFLYQPLLGPLCISLYLVLRSQVAEDRLVSRRNTHYFLMNVMDTGLAEIYSARLRLEAIGLLETYVKKAGDRRSFVYELKPPLSPARFFSDELLNMYLFQQVGKKQYMNLKSYFMDQRLPEPGYEKITKSFPEVFASVIPDDGERDEMENGEGLKAMERPMAKSLRVEPQDFDFQLLVGLVERVVPRFAITPEVKEVIFKLAFLYGFDPIEMKDILMESLTDGKEIDVEKMRKKARDRYLLFNYQKLPKIVDRIQSPALSSNIAEPKTPEERLIRYLETVSPRQLLEDLSRGGTASEADLRLVEDIMIRQKLPPGVVNVLIHYCMLRTDMKFSRSFAERIASHWARKEVRTVRQAMDLAKSEHQKYLNWQKEKEKDKKNPKTRRALRKERLPEWFDSWEIIEEKEEDIEDIEEERRKLEERLKNISGGSGVQSPDARK